MTTRRSQKDAQSQYEIAGILTTNISFPTAEDIRAITRDRLKDIETYRPIFNAILEEIKLQANEGKYSATVKLNYIPGTLNHIIEYISNHGFIVDISNYESEHEVTFSWDTKLKPSRKEIVKPPYIEEK